MVIKRKDKVYYPVKGACKKPVYTDTKLVHGYFGPYLSLVVAGFNFTISKSFMYVWRSVTVTPSAWLEVISQDVIGSNKFTHISPLLFGM